jgi:uncharacterized protein (DUF2236 family)
MSSAPAALERHRAAVRARLIRAGAIRPGPGSITWRINSEAIVVGGWGRAILLQLAHPLIAAGVAEHSSFRGSLMSSFRRLASTVRAMLMLTFGSDDQAIHSAAGINFIHDRVFGHLRERAGAFDAGAAYSAHDPELLRWVHATLIESIPLTYELLVGPLTSDERDRYCVEAAIIEPLLDIPAGLLPRSSAQLDGYIQEMLASGRVAVSAASRALAHAVIYPPHWRVMWPTFRPVQLITLGLLPPVVREAYGFRWTARDQRAFARWTAFMRTVYRAMPAFIRQWPAARRPLERERLLTARNFTS